ncbi:hypothetical protein DPMN_193180 [Dreissena polymorpha]|uniref:Uncharacterized protein n=1 Tax=Dreissena polymorpha TaxID=45954 RepID=A0A9D3Y3F2_DREPO|nr:hypothetical protein DPMN_193180 [Dreissena polymorpha]
MCVSVLRKFCEKLENQRDKLVEFIGDTDQVFIDLMLDEDCQLMLDTEWCIGGLEQVIRESEERLSKAASES